MYTYPSEQDISNVWPQLGALAQQLLWLEDDAIAIASVGEKAAAVQKPSINIQKLETHHALP